MRLLEVGDSHLAEVCNTKDKANSIEDVGFPTPVQPCDGVELLVKWADGGSVGITFETIDDDFVDVHNGEEERGRQKRSGK